MKTILDKGFLILLLIGAASCTEQQSMTSDSTTYANILDVSADGLSTVIAPNMQSALVKTSDLLDDELAVLLKMKEEEKLARDVYAALNVKWSTPIFSRISKAENNHMNAIIGLLSYYGSPDTLVAAAGIFQNADIQALYTDLVTTGTLTLEEGYTVGALIEEMDINDIQESSLVTSNENILLVFENLERGSRNHLRSFNRQLTTLGIKYAPVYISQAEFDEIVSSAIEKGQGYAMNGNCQGTGTGNRRGYGGSGDGGQHSHRHGN